MIAWLSCHNLLNVPQLDFPSGNGFDFIQSPQEYIYLLHIPAISDGISFLLWLVFFSKFCLQ